jgi:hypothetical protein
MNDAIKPKVRRILRGIQTKIGRTAPILYGIKIMLVPDH